MPPETGWELETGDGPVVATQKLADLVQCSLRYQFWTRTFGYLSGDVSQYLLSLLVGTEHPGGSVKAYIFEVA
jgi:hypothetical protein